MNNKTWTQISKELKIRALEHGIVEALCCGRKFSFNVEDKKGVLADDFAFEFITANFFNLKFRDIVYILEINKDKSICVLELIKK